jgi:hypothetical protein
VSYVTHGSRYKSATETVLLIAISPLDSSMIAADMYFPRPLFQCTIKLPYDKIKPFLDFEKEVRLVRYSIVETLSIHKTDVDQKKRTNRLAI